MITSKPQAQPILIPIHFMKAILSLYGHPCGKPCRQPCGWHVGKSYCWCYNSYMGTHMGSHIGDHMGVGGIHESLIHIWAPMWEHASSRM